MVEKCVGFGNQQLSTGATMKGESSETIPQGSRESVPEMVETLVYFYVLKDPRSGEVRYFGRTVDPKARLRHHIYEAKKKNRNRREKWVVSLLRRNMKPLLEVVYQTKCSFEEASATEKLFIKKLKRRFNLTNGVDHGLGGTVSSKTCYQFQTEDGSLVASHANVNQASITTGVKDVNIARCCKNENGYGTKTAGGFFWSYLPYPKYPHKYLSEWRNLKGKAVVCIDSEGNELEFETARLAEKATGVSYKKISSCANGRQKTAGGYKWKFKR